MRIDRIQPGDIVKAAVKGRTIYGEVTEVRRGLVCFMPITAAAGWRHASPHEVVGHWRRSGRHGPRLADDQAGDAALEPPRQQLSLPIQS